MKFFILFILFIFIFFLIGLIKLYNSYNISYVCNNMKEPFKKMCINSNKTYFIECAGGLGNRFITLSNSITLAMAKNRMIKSIIIKLFLFK